MSNEARQIPQDDFVVLTLDQYANSLAQYIPDGKLTLSKNIVGSNLRNLLNGLSLEGIRCEELISAISVNHDINQTYDYIQEWERAVSIPDHCFPGTGTIEERRLDVIVKLALMNISTQQQYIDLAALYGYPIRVTTGFIESHFPWIFPHIFFGDTFTAHFTIVIDFLTVPLSGVFPVPFPWEFESPVTQKIECIFNQMVPANVKVVYRYLG